MGAKGGRDPEKDWVKSLVDCEPVPLLRVKLEETEPSGGNLLDCWLDTWGWLNWGDGGWLSKGVNGVLVASLEILENSNVNKKLVK